jgi:hypothetical protein
MFCVIHTDDVDCVAEKQEDMDVLFSHLDSRFGVTAGDVDFMLGLNRSVSADGKTVEIKMTGFVEELYRKYEGHVPKRTPESPVPAHLYLEKSDPETADPVTAKKVLGLGYQKVVGGLLWAARNCYPECSIGVQYLCRQMSGPTTEGWEAAMHMVAYLHKNKEQGIRFVRCDSPQLTMYYDASNKADIADGVAVGGHLAMLCGGPIEWNCKKLPKDTPGQSSHHNEYMALAACSKTTQWLRYLLQEMGLGDWVSGPTPVYGDNDACTTFSREDYITQANRYYRKDAHFAKKAFDLGWTNPVRVPTDDNLADGFTKALAGPQLKKLSAILKGHVEIPLASRPEARARNYEEELEAEDALDAHIVGAGVRKMMSEHAEREKIFRDVPPERHEGELELERESPPRSRARMHVAGRAAAGFSRIAEDVIGTSVGLYGF